MSKSIVKKALQMTESDDDEDQSMSSAKQPKLQGKHSDEGSSIGGGKKRSTLEEYRTKQSKKVNLNSVKQLERLRSIKVDKRITNKILTNLGKTSKKESVGTTSTQEKSFFTEEDFKRYVKSIV